MEFIGALLILTFAFSGMLVETDKERIVALAIIFIVLILFFIIPPLLKNIYRHEGGIIHKINPHIEDLVKLIKRKKAKGVVCKVSGKYLFFPAQNISIEKTDEPPYIYIKVANRHIPLEECEIIYNILGQNELQKQQKQEQTQTDKLLKILFIFLVFVFVFGSLSLYKALHSSFSLSTFIFVVVIAIISMFCYIAFLGISVLSEVAEEEKRIGEDKKKKLYTAKGIRCFRTFYPKDQIQILDGTINFVRLPDDRIVPLRNCEIVRGQR